MVLISRLLEHLVTLATLTVHMFVPWVFEVEVGRKKALLATVGQQKLK